MWYTMLIEWKLFMIISKNAKNTTHKIQHNFMTTTLNNLNTERTYFKIIQAIYVRPRVEHHTQWWKIESVSSNIRNKTRVPTFITVIHKVLEILARAMRQDKEIKSIQNEKEEVKLPLFKIIWYYTSNISDSTRKPVKLIHGFSQVAGCKINVQKPVVST